MRSPAQGGYAEEDNARWIAEPVKSAARSEFERDRARIVHSAAFRKLGAKTQVMGPTSDDFVRTRLTHSLEVAQVGREIGKELGADPDVVDTACLAHDLGHPPFGHNGERALAELAATCGGFEGNAQTFRLVTRLEPKVQRPDGAGGGLNLTRASLDAISKYPWLPGEGNDPVKSCRKYGVYEDDREVFQWMRQTAPATVRRCLEAQIMDLADDIGYCVHDVEDAVITGKFSPPALADEVHFEAIVADTLAWYGDAVNEAALEDARRELLNAPFWPGPYDGSYRSRVEVKNLTSQLIGRFTSETVNATRELSGGGALRRYRADLVVPARTRAQIQLLKGIAVHFVMAPREFEPMYLRQRTLLADLVDALWERGAPALEAPFAADYRAGADDSQRLRAVIDQVASLTDISASQWHARLCGLLSSVY